MPQATANGISIEYDTFGDKSCPALLLITGGGSQMIHWENGFCDSLAQKGYYVIRFDNRDAGLSQKFEEMGIPDIAAAMKGTPVPPPYTIEDMADDSVGLLDALKIDKAHICGASMGGMIAQAVSYRHPERVRSLISIMSSTGNPELPKIKQELFNEVYKPVPDQREEYVTHYVQLWRKIWSPGFPFEEDRVANLVRESFDRSYYPQGMVRQSMAVMTHGFPKAPIASIKAPTLVIHGDKDPFMPVEGGRETAHLIRDAELFVIEGMGHDMPKDTWLVITNAMVEHMQKA